MNQLVWAQRHTAEPAWAAGGTYPALRIVHFHIEAWQKISVARQERIIGRRKASGAPMYATDPNAPNTLDPVYTNDPQGLITALNSHIRLANPQTRQTASTSSILRRSYDYDTGSDSVSVIDTRTHRAVRTLPTGRFPVGVAVTPDGKSVYVANEVAATVSIIATGTGKVTGSVPVGAGPFAVTLGPDGRRLYVTVLGPGNIAVIDTGSHRVSGSVNVGPPGTDPFNIAVTPAAVYVTDQGGGTFSVINPKTLKVVKTLTLGNSPYGVAVTP
jgi:YVTN family beta-propeller protein